MTDVPPTTRRAVARAPPAGSRRRRPPPASTTTRSPRPSRRTSRRTPPPIAVIPPAALADPARAARTGAARSAGPAGTSPRRTPPAPHRRLPLQSPPYETEYEPPDVPEYIVPPAPPAPEYEVPPAPERPRTNRRPRRTSTLPAIEPQASASRPVDPGCHPAPRGRAAPPRPRRAAGCRRLRPAAAIRARLRCRPSLAAAAAPAPSRRTGRHRVGARARSPGARPRLPVAVSAVHRSGRDAPAGPAASAARPSPPHRRAALEPHGPSRPSRRPPPTTGSSAPPPAFERRRRWSSRRRRRSDAARTADAPSRAAHRGRDLRRPDRAAARCARCASRTCRVFRRPSACRRRRCRPTTRTRRVSAARSRSARSARRRAAAGAAVRGRTRTPPTRSPARRAPRPTRSRAPARPRSPMTPRRRRRRARRDRARLARRERRRRRRRRPHLRRLPPVDERRARLAGAFPSEPISTQRVTESQPGLVDQRPENHPVFVVEDAGVEPTALDLRAGRAARLFWLWFATNSSVVSIAIGAVLFSLGMSLRQAIVATLAGVALSFLPLGLGTLAGKWSGQPTMVVSRADLRACGQHPARAHRRAHPRVLGRGAALGARRLDRAPARLRRPGCRARRDRLDVRRARHRLRDRRRDRALRLRIRRAHAADPEHPERSARRRTDLPDLPAPRPRRRARRAGDGSWTLVLGGAVIVFSFVGLAWVQSSSDLARYQRPASSGAQSMLWATIGATLPPFALIVWGAMLAASDPVLATGLATSPLPTIARLLPLWYPAPLLAAAGLGLLSSVVLAMYSGGFALQAVGLKARRSVTTLIAAVLVAAVAAGLVVLVGRRPGDRTRSRDDARRAGRRVGGHLRRRDDDPHPHASTRRRCSRPEASTRRCGSRTSSAFLLLTGVGFGLTTATFPGLTWQGFLFPLIGVAADSPARHQRHRRARRAAARHHRAARDRDPGDPPPGARLPQARAHRADPAHHRADPAADRSIPRQTGAAPAPTRVRLRRCPRPPPRLEP